MGGRSTPARSSPSLIVIAPLWMTRQRPRGSPCEFWTHFNGPPPEMLPHRSRQFPCPAIQGVLVEIAYDTIATLAGNRR